MKCSEGSTILFHVDFFCNFLSAAAAHREQAPEAEDRHTRESECSSVCHRCSVTTLTITLHYINPSSCVCSHIMNLFLKG